LQITPKITLKTNLLAWKLLYCKPSFEVAGKTNFFVRITKINTNILYIEYLRLQGNYEEMGKYAKMIVTQAFLVENLVKSHGFLVDPKLTDFVLICQKLYKAISLWSLFFTYLPKLKTDTYHDGEDINTLAGGCCSFVEHIAQLHREVVAYPPVKSSFLYGVVCFYFKDILVSKSLE